MYLDFDYMYDDKVMSSITFDKETGEPSVVNYTDCILDTFLGKQECTLENIITMLSLRVIEEERHDIKDCLEYHGLSTWDPYTLCLKTEGRLTDDRFWIRFKTNEQNKRNE